ncbi:MAG TPA: XrtN system VIT domain-containing protein [Chryseosolibacter sp.]
METIADLPVTPAFSVENDRKSSSPDRTTLLGYVILGVSAGLYGLEEYYDVRRGDDTFTIFFIHYFIALAYVIILFVNKSYGIRRSWRSEKIYKTVVLLNLFLVSAYALNRELPVFEESVPWFCLYLVLMSSVTLSYRYFERLPRAVNYVQHALLGSALLLYLYLAIYVADFYMLGSVGVILFGVGGHIFVPLLLFFSVVRLLMVTHRKKNIGARPVIAGVLISVAFVTGFAVKWNARVKAIDRLANQSVIHSDTELPVWVKVAQTVDNDWITERILKSKLVYTISNNHFHWDFFGNGNDWDEKRKHDPLVFITGGISRSSLSDDDRKNILKATTDSRHKAEERLWAGDNLSTAYIVTDVDIYPELRIAYSEHYLNIRNNALNSDRWWGNTEEAIYTFQLPEGSVVTSLSLWVDGNEEKAILTSRQKAAAAYTTVVGREARDPSVVRWQEGNTISVRVFPCTPQEERKFKIGITSPLPVVGNKVAYRNVTFRGPNAGSATQLSRVRFVGETPNTGLPDGFTRNLKGEYIREGEYDPDLTITMDALPIRTNQFSFDGFRYSLSDLDPAMSEVVFTDIYLDINKSWTSGEIASLYPLLTDYNVYAYAENDLIRLSSENWAGITDGLKKTNFSLFPFHHIKDRERSIVITKGEELSPFLRDFKTSAFADGISRYFREGRKVYVFNLEGGMSTYIKSLKELRAFNFADGNTTVLLTLLKNKTFPMTIESGERIVLHQSDMVIERKESNEVPMKDNAPDHLARLFAYNNIMRQVGANFFKDDFINEKLVDEAATAYVVSPVSSLIVLETKKDYERFGITDKENSLHNATRNSSGAVPEPHEWALIIVFLLFVAFHVLRYGRLKSASAQK